MSKDACVARGDKSDARDQARVGCLVAEPGRAAGLTRLFPSRIPPRTPPPATSPLRDGLCRDHIRMAPAERCLPQAGVFRSRAAPEGVFSANVGARGLAGAPLGAIASIDFG